MSPRAELMARTRSAPDDLVAWLKLAAVCRMEGDRDAALNAATGAVTASPLDFTALLLRADILDALNDPQAPLAYERALAQRPERGLPPGMEAAVARAEAARATLLARREERLQAAGAVLDLDQGERTRVARFTSNILRRTRTFHSEPTNFHYPGLTELEFHDPAASPWLAQVAAETDAIAAEFEGVLNAERAELIPYISYQAHEPVAQWQVLNNSRDWTAIHLIRNGIEIAANARHCPRTMAMLSRLPQPAVPGCSPNAMFSLLAPGAIIPPHNGVANTRLICHLPLVVPADCSFRVGATTVQWQKGKPFLFDDTIEHEASNLGGALRVVLIFDVWHPDLSAAERRAVGAMMAADVATIDARPDTGL